MLRDYGSIGNVCWLSVVGLHPADMCMVFEMLGDNLLTLIKAYKYRGIPVEIVRQLTRSVGSCRMWRCRRDGRFTVAVVWYRSRRWMVLLLCFGRLPGVHWSALSAHALPRHSHGSEAGERAADTAHPSAADPSVPAKGACLPCLDIWGVLQFTRPSPTSTLHS